ncbi:MAG: NAD-dependent epimerase/dehydratase family protein [Dolichospermum sp.]
MQKLLVTGSSGLIGSEVCLHFASLGWEIHGVDNTKEQYSLAHKETLAGINNVYKG